MAEVKPSTSNNTVELVGEASSSGANGSPSPRSVPPASAAESPSFLTWMWIQILTACSGVWGARGGGLSAPRVLGLASGAQQTQEISRRIAASKSTWSEVPGGPVHHSAAVPCPSQLSAWEELKQSAPRFFNDWWVEQLQIGRLIAEGGQAQIFEAKLKGDDFKYVVKVFKLEAGISLDDFKRHWPRRVKKGGEGCSEFRSTEERSRFIFDDISLTLDESRCIIWMAALLKNGSFAFLMKRYWGDLRTLINLKVEQNTQNPHPSEFDSLLKPPFSFLNCIWIMTCIARGMQGLHAEGVLHRDLKAANVLIRGENFEYMYCDVADYECAMFVKGTGFWRAPEVLQEFLKDEKDRNDEIWTQKVDVYSFGMTCYEILTGQIPFDGYTKSKWGDVIKGERPHLPNYVFPQLRELVEACWHTQPFQRPSFDVILEKLNSLWKNK